MYVCIYACMCVNVNIYPPLDDLIVDVSEIAAVGHIVAKMAQQTEKDVICHVRPSVPCMGDARIA